MPTTSDRISADPTPRTIEQLNREVLHLKELIETRFDSNDKAIVRLQEIADSQPTPGIVMAAVVSLRELTDKTYASLKELMVEKFEGNKTALDAALKTQKEGSDKIESNFTKQFDNIATNSQTQAKAFDDKVTSVKDDLNKLEGRVGAIESRGSGRNDVIGYLAIAIAAGAGLIAIFGKFGA